MNNIIALSEIRKNFRIIFRDNPCFQEVNGLCEEMYQSSGILDKNRNFNIFPELYSGIFQGQSPLAILGAFTGNDLIDLPIDKALHYVKQPGPKIEIGRLAFAKKPKTEKEKEEIFFLTRELVDNYYRFVRSRYPHCRNFYFETHNRIVELLSLVFGPEIMIPLKCEVIWENIPPEQMGFYKKFRTGEAGLYRINLEKLEASLTGYTSCAISVAL